MSEKYKTQFQWNDIESQLDSLRPVEGGFSEAKRGLIDLPNGVEAFVKIGNSENTKKWAQKEIKVYRMLHKHNYPYVPALLAVNDEESAFAIEAFPQEAGWDWHANWDVARLDETVKAMDALASLQLNDSERNYLAGAALDMDKDGWGPLSQSKEKQSVLIRKLKDAGKEDVSQQVDFITDAQRSVAYDFHNENFVHFDMRADNCAWNVELGQARIVDWNWAQIGDRDLEMAAFLVSVVKSGLKLPKRHQSRLTSDALHWMAGFWLESAASPIWPGGPEDLRRLQLDSGVIAWELSKKV
jgi:hypothetical protein